MRSRLRLWLAPAIIGVSLTLGLFLTRLLSGPGVAFPPDAQATRQAVHELTLSAQGADAVTMPAVSISASGSAAAQERAPAIAVPASAALGTPVSSSSGNAAPGHAGESLSQADQGALGPPAALGGASSTESTGSTSALAPMTEDAVPFGMIGQIRIDRIDLDAPIVEVSWHLGEIDGQTVAEWDTHPDAAGHHRGSGTLGGEGNCVLSGHSRAVGTGGAVGVFQRLEELRAGDRILLVDTSGGEYVYVVQELVKVAELGASLEQRRAHAAYMAPSQEARLTLITCWPDWAYTHRLIVIARRA